MHDPAVVRPHRPWAVSFGVGQVFAGCILAGGVFTALIFLWLALLVPDDVFASFDPPVTVAEMTLYLGGLGGVLLLVVGPTLAFVVGWLLRRVANQSVHVIAFAVAGALVGIMVGSFFGPDLASALGATMGASAGLSRMIMSRWARA